MKNEKKAKFLAILGFLFITFIWGSTYVVLKNTLDSIPPFQLLWIRFALATLLLILVFPKKLFRISIATLKCGLISGLFLCGTYAFQTYGIQYTSATNAALITNCYIIFVPVINLIVYRAYITRSSKLGFILATVGVLFLSVKPGFQFSSRGDLIVLLCSICYAGFIVYLNYHSAGTDPIALTMLQMMVITLICLVFSFTTETQVPISELPLSAILSELYLSLFGSFTCILLLNICEKQLCVVMVSILLTLEAVFGILIAIPCLKEQLSLYESIGCILVFIAIIIVIISHRHSNNVSHQQCHKAPCPDRCVK